MTYNNNNNSKGQARVLCGLFLKLSEQAGMVRTCSERDVQVLESWVRQGLTPEVWGAVIADHIQYCKRTGRDMARGVGYFAKPVSRALAMSDDSEVNESIKKTTRKLRVVG